MKSKIASFIMTILVILIISILILLGIFVYQEIYNEDSNQIEEFESTYNPTSENSVEDTKKITTPQLIKDKISQIINSSSENNNKTENKYENVQIDKYFYNQLNDYSKIIYNALEQNKENMKTGTYEVNLGTEFSDVLSNDNGQKVLGDYYQSAIEAYVYDNPDVFYIDFSKLYLNIETTTRGIKRTYKVFLNEGNGTNYLTDEFSTIERINSALSEVENIKSYIIQNKKNNDFQNVKLVHDYLVENIDYEQTISKPNIYNLYGALVNKECVCEGYAKAFK